MVATHHPLTLDVTDCGPLVRASVELRPLTVFVGPSNTGKSWLATLVYALYRYFESSSPRWFPWHRTGIEPPKLPEGAEVDLRNLADQLAASSLSAKPLEQGLELTDPILTAIRLHLDQQGEAVGREIERCFGIDADTHLIRKGSVGPARIELRHGVDRASAVQALTFSDEKWTLASAIPDGMRIRSDRYGFFLDAMVRAEHESRSVPTRRIYEAIGALSHDVLLSYRPAFYLPAGRATLMNTHGTVMSALLRSATMAGIRGAGPLPPLPGVRSDFLEQLVEIASDQRRRDRSGTEHLSRLGESIEDRILGGAVKVESSTGVAYPHFIYRPRGWESKLPLANASSMVSELAPVVLYLRHVVVPGDLLIIDEPESHLHPAMQVAFTRLIAATVRAGVQVIVTTHSEWVLEELGNVVGRSPVIGRSMRTDESGTESGETSLDARDVGVWLFEPAEDGGSAVKEIALDTDTGIYPSGFDAVAATLHNDWAAIADPRGDTE